VTSVVELREIVDALGSVPASWVDACAGLMSTDLSLIDPRTWGTS
jgi:hypothetical protein